VARPSECEDLHEANDICDGRPLVAAPKLGARGGASMSSLSFKLAVVRHYRAVYGFAAAMLGDPA
jgi:hypothetical protein